MRSRYSRGAFLLLLAVFISLLGCGDSKKAAAADPGCENSQDYTGAGMPYHTVAINNSNEFSSEREAFSTSTAAQTGYTAYVSWDECRLYLGYTGSAIGAGDCTDLSLPTCRMFDLGQSPFKYLIYYIDTDPNGEAGTRAAKRYENQDWVLPFQADYLFAIRTDGRSFPHEDTLAYNGNVEVYRYGTDSWERADAGLLKIGHNRGSSFIELAVDLAELRSPCAIQIVSWIVDTEHSTSYGFWPARAGGESSDADGSGSGGAQDTTRSGNGTLADTVPPEQGQEEEGSPREQSPRPSDQVSDPAAADAISAPPPMRIEHYYGFPLVDGVIPNASANLDRTSYERAEECAARS